MTKAWEDHKGVIIGEYKMQNKPLHEVQRIMEQKYRFKASTRAYRSRFDKWGVHKYSCRKRKGSVGTATGREWSEGDNDAAVFSPSETPDPDESDSSPIADSDSSVSPLSPQDQQFFPPGICGATPPSDLGSPTNATIKFEPQSQYIRSQMIAPPPIRHTMSLPNPGYMSDSHFRLTFEQHHHHHQHQNHHQEPQQQQHPRFGPQGNYYRPGTEEHAYHQLQGPGPMNLAVSSSSLPASPSQGGYAQLHSNGRLMGYGGYPLDGVDGIKSPPE